MKIHPPPKVQTMTLSVMGLDQSSYFKCRVRRHLDPVFTVSNIHCSYEQTISVCESSRHSPAFSAVQLHNALSSDQDGEKQGMLRLCTSAKAWRQESSGGRKGEWQWGGNVQVVAICYQKYKLSASRSFPVLPFWELVHQYFNSRAQAVFITLHYSSLAAMGLHPKRMRYSLALPAR